ncbi:branched-chain amino acid ABC transporter permease [Anaerofustis stercorihominis]|uniref:branched-chain amino acid ABC transporter permease n=1 Tax=Anaerofustis stercorihominis TaxID=214853 RepID=UPI0026724FD3|nr:branched-chain amino acid ABC transporter permease [Anaerofustis stercorihominis]
MKFFDFFKKKDESKISGLSDNLPTLLIFLAAYVIIKLLIVVGIISPFYETVVLKLCIDIILGLGLNLITGITGQFSLGHAGFMAIGAYTSALMTLRISSSPVMIILAVILGGILSGFLGFLIGIPTLRLRGDYLAIATLGLGEIIKIVIQNVDQTILGGAAGLSSIPLYSSFEFCFICMVICYFVITNVLKSSFGRACISVREDEIASESMGVNVTKAKILAFIIGTFFAGVAGALYSGYVGVIQPKNFGFMKSIDILMIVVLGGLGNINGTIIAAFILNIVSFALQDFAELRMILYSLLLIAIMLIKSGETPFFVKLREMFSIENMKKKLNSRKAEE